MPCVNENVLVTVTENKSTHLEVKLVEYKMLSDMMKHENITRKKGFLVNKVVVAKVKEILNDSYVKLSISP